MNQISDILTKTTNSVQYSLNTMINSTLYGVPIVTVGLIGLTSMVLAYVTIAETNDGSQSSTTNSMIPQSMNPLAPSVPSTNNAPPTQITGGKSGGKSKKNKSKKLRKPKV